MAAAGRGTGGRPGTGGRAGAAAASGAGMVGAACASGAGTVGAVTASGAGTVGATGGGAAAAAGGGAAAAGNAVAAAGATPSMVPFIAAERWGATPSMVPFIGSGGAMAGGAVDSPRPRTPPSTGLGPVRRASPGGSTLKEVPHFGQRILSPLDGILRSST
jgi:hypothetical protein